MKGPLRNLYIPRTDNFRRSNYRHMKKTEKIAEKMKRKNFVSAEIVIQCIEKAALHNAALYQKPK